MSQKIPNDKSRQLAKAVHTAAGSTTYPFTLENAAVLVSLYVQSVAGTVNVEVFTYADLPEESLKVIDFPTISAPSTDLLLRKAAAALGNCYIVVTYSGAVTYSITAKGVSTGATDARILGVNTISTSKITVGTSGVIAISSALTDRQSMGIQNNSTTATLTIAESLAQLSTGGWQVYPQQPFFMDIQAGVEIYVISSESGTDVRFIEGGG